MPDKARATVVPSELPRTFENTEDDRVEFYPAYCYRASPTWFTWVKLTAHDVHNHLQSRQGFQIAPTYVDTTNGWMQNQNPLLFYLNHPIQFLQLVGVVVTFDEYFEKFWLFTIDDSSGATIEINCRKPEKQSGETREETGNPQQKDTEAEARWNTMNKIDIGMVVQVKGHIGMFREVRQLQLDRISIIRDTNHEMQLVAARTKFRDQVLSTPWELTPMKQKSLRDHAFGESEEQKEHARRRRKALQMKVEREKRHAERIAKRYEQEEKNRQEGAREAYESGLLVRKSMRK